MFFTLFENSPFDTAAIMSKHLDLTVGSRMLLYS
jgi:hypothetical protein